MIKFIRKPGSYYLHMRSTYYFISFPKSGRTWIKSFLANYYSGYLQIPLFYDFSPLVSMGKRKRIPRIIFTHPPHRGVGDEDYCKYVSKLSDKKVIFLIRDPERVVFTYYHRLLKRMHDKEVTEMTLQEFVRDPSLGISQIVTFMNFWYASRRDFKDFILVRYEDCVRDPLKEFTQLLDYLDTPIHEKEMSLALSKSVDTTRKIEQHEFVSDGSLQSDILKGSEYFESKSIINDIDGYTCDRYSGDESSYRDNFTSEDRQYMKEEISRLSPVLQYD